MVQYCLFTLEQILNILKRFKLHIDSIEFLHFGRIDLQHDTTLSTTLIHTNEFSIKTVDFWPYGGC